MREDDEAFDAFVRARLPHLLRFGRALTGSEHAGADLVQDALERTSGGLTLITTFGGSAGDRLVGSTDGGSTWHAVR